MKSKKVLKIITCPCGSKVNIFVFSKVNRTKYCNKKCFYLYRPKTGFKNGHPFYKGGEKGWFKKGIISWSKGKTDELSPVWKGNKIGYWGVHSWIERKLGKPKKCEFCGNTTAKRFEWANISGKYLRNKEDWKRLCKKCHSRYDYEQFGDRRVFYT